MISKSKPLVKPMVCTVPSRHMTQYLKYLTPHGISGNKALAKFSVAAFTARYDAAIILCQVGSFAAANERSLHWKIPMGPELPWYASEIPTVAISVAQPFLLFDLVMVPVYINTYSASREALRQTAEKLTCRATRSADRRALLHEFRTLVL